MKHSLHTRILALVMAIAIVLSTGVLNSAGWLLASGGEQEETSVVETTESQPQQGDIVVQPVTIPSSEPDESGSDPSESSSAPAGETSAPAGETSAPAEETSEPTEVSEPASVTLRVVLRAVYSDGKAGHTIGEAQELVFAEGEQTKTFVAEIPEVEGYTFATSMTARDDGKYETVLSRPSQDAEHYITVTYTPVEAPEEVPAEGSVTLTVNVTFAYLNGEQEATSAQYPVIFAADEQTKDFTFTAPAVEGYTAAVDDELFTQNGSSFTASLTRPEADDTYELVVLYCAEDDASDYNIEPTPAVVSAYVFVVDGTEVDRQWVKNGDTVYAPASPEKEGYKFTGWYDSEGNAFAAGAVEVTGSVTYTYTARFEEVHYVFFMDTDNRVAATKEGIAGDVIAADVTFPVNADEAITGWYTDSALTSRVDSVTLESTNVTLYPKVETGHWITYDSNGGTYIAPVFVAPSSNTAAPAEPTREGYTFQSWYNGDTVFTFGGKLTVDITLTAQWQGNPNTQYTVIHWQENVDDDKFSFKESETMTGTTGELTAAVAKSYDGFTVQEIEQQTISGDGSTIVNVYYKRNVYTINFWPTNGSSGSQTLICGKEEHTHNWRCYDWRGNLTCTKEEHTHDSSCYETSSSGALFTITAKYGANISDQWPSRSNGSTNWSTKKGGGSPYQAGIDVMPLGGGNFYVPSSESSSSKSASYYVEVLEGEQGTVVNGRTYKLHHTDTVNLSRPTVSDEDFYNITGFTRNTTDSTQNGSSYNGAKFYYYRNSYEIQFINNGSVEHTVTKQYEANISDVSYTPTRPVGIPAEYEFVGWYDNELGQGEEYVFSGTMPAKSITVYAKWAAPTYTGTAYLTMGGGDSEKIEISYGATIDEDALPKITIPTGFTWRGWATRDADGNYFPFNFNTKIYSDITLYPYYTSNQKFTVSYDAGAGTGTVTDAKQYADGSFADVQHTNGLTAPEGKVFLGWQYNGKTYQPGDKIQIQAANITFTAIWGDKADAAILTYKANYPAGVSGAPADVTVPCLNNETVTVRDGFTAPEGYEFVGWATSASATTAQYQPGSKIVVDNKSENILYALWKQSTFTVTYAYSGTAPEGAPAVPAAQTRKAGESVTLEAAPTMDGYYFSGWTTSDATVTEGAFTMPASNVTITGEWIAKKSIEVEAKSGTFTYDGQPHTVSGLKTTEFTVDGQTYSVSGLTASRTETAVGTYTVAVTGTPTVVNADGVDVTHLFTVTTKSGSLVITEYTGKITVTTTGGTFTYDGEAHGATVEVTGLPTGYTVDTATSNDTATHVADGTVTANCDTLVIKNAQGVDVTDELNIDYVDGTIEITPATLTVTTPSASKVYDNTALTAAGTISGFVKEETATFVTTGAQTTVGNSKNTYTLIWEGTAVQTDYTISESIGTLTVTEYADEIVVTTTGGSFPYDGEAHGATVTVSTLPEGYTLETASSDDTATHVAEGTVTANCDTLVIKNAQGVDVTGKLNIKYVDGSITITPATLTITTPDASKVYDNTALTAAGSITGFVKDEYATFITTGSRTTVGSSDNTYSLTWDGTAAESDYTISENIGTLTITEYAGEITVTTTGGTFTYDGEAHGATVSVSTLPTGYTLETATSSASATHVAEGTVAANCDTLVIRNAQGENVTAKLNIKYVSGSITITPATLTITTPDASKVYDGDPLTKAGSISGFVKDEDATFITTGTQTEVGSSSNTYSLTWDGSAVESDYTISETIGTLTVTENADEIVVTTTGGTFSYDGTTHKATVSVSELPKGYTLETATSNDSATHVADGTVTANCDTLVIKNAQGVDVTSKLNIRYVNDTITITPVTLTVTTPDASKVYDGDPLTKAGSITGFVNGETATFATTGTQTAVGSSTNTYSLTWNSTAAESDYTISETLGTLTVSEYTGVITVTTTGGTFTYDGKAHGATVSVSTLPKGYTLVTATSDDTATHVAEGTVTANCDTLVIKNAQGVDVTKKLNIAYVDGTITITPAPLTITTPSATKVYDGEPLTKAGTYSGFVNGETAAITFNGSQTEVGSSWNSFIIDWTNATAEATDYARKEILGRLTVTEYAGEIPVTTTGGIFTYDGEAHGATVSVAELPKGYTLITATSSASATHVAEGTVTATCDTLVIKNAQGVDVTSRLNIKYVDGSIKITPATLTVTTLSASKVYDGDPLTAAGSITGFVNGETATFTVTGSQTKVDSSDNTYTLDWNGSAVESDYTISESIGTLTVTENADEIVVTTTGGTFTYDGQAHGATVSVSTLPAGYTLETAVSNDTATHVLEGTVTANCDTLVIRNAQGEDVTSRLNIRYVDGSITITPATLTIVTPDASKVYDGDPLTAEGTITGFVNGESATFATTGIQITEGSSDNTYSLTWDSTATESDYTVSATVGTLTVTQYTGEIVVTTTGGTFTYDGQAHGATVSVSTLPTGYTLETAVSNDTATHVAEGTVTANCDTLVIRNAQGENVTSKLNIRYVDGSITITPATLTVTTLSASKVYDSDPLTAGGSISGFVNEETATFTVTGTQTEEGSSDNTYSITWDSSAVQSDYTISESLGTLTVTQYTGEIVVTTTGGTFPYDGEAHGATVTVSTLPKGYTLETAASNDTATHVADGTVTANCDTLVIRNASGEDVTAKLNIKYVNGSITITPATLTVVTPDAGKVYDGDPLTAAGSISGFVNGETANFATTGTQTEVGNSKNTYSLTWEGTAAQSDYTISESIGTLTVIEYAGEILVTTTGGEIPYDGDTHTATVSVSTLPKGYTLITAASSSSATHVADGTVFATCDTLVIQNASGEDVTKKLNIKYVDDTLTITPATLTIITPDATKVYDTKPLTAAGTITGFVNDETATFTTTGSQTRVGYTANTYSLIWEGTAVASDYTISESIGTLTVTPPEKWDIVEKSHEDTDGVYKLGDEIRFTITVENIFDAEAKVTITEQPGVQLLDESGKKIGTTLETTLAAGETLTIQAVYTVQEKDLLNGSFTNEVNVSVETELGELTDKDTDAVEDLEDPNPKLTVVKTTTSKPQDSAAGYSVGETIRYQITVENTGNITITDIQVTDSISGVAASGDTVLADGITLAPGEKATYTFEHVVTEEDLGSTVVNEAIATGKNPTEKDEDPDNDIPTTVDDEKGKTEDDTVDPVHSLSIVKEITNPKEVYKLNDTIRYQITVTNNGNVTERNVTVEDTLTGAKGGANRFKFVALDGGKIVDGKVVFETMAPGTSRVITCEYRIVNADEGGTIVNTASVTSDDADPETSEAVGGDVEVLYDLYILYVDEDWKVVAPNYFARLSVGDRYSITSPVVEGYTANRKVVMSGEKGMPAKDVWEYVIYTKDEVPEEPVNPGEDPTDPSTEPSDPSTEPTYDLTPITDEQTPLANVGLEGDHTCCLMHFLIMLVSMITLGFYTSDRKKLQKSIFEVKKALKAEGVDVDEAQEEKA